MSDDWSCSLDIAVDDDLEAALKRLRRVRWPVLADLSRRRRDGPKPGVRRRNKHYFRPNRDRKRTYANGDVVYTSVSDHYRKRVWSGWPW